MNIKTTIAAAGILSALSFSAFAAQSIDANQAASLQPMGTISVSGVSAAPSDVRQALSEKADNKGAKAYRVVEAYINGNYHATAEIYQ